VVERGNGPTTIWLFPEGSCSEPLSETNGLRYTLWRKVGSPHMISRRWRYPEDFRRMAVERFKCCENIE
jgi:hypothetical protein